MSLSHLTSSASACLLFPPSSIIPFSFCLLESPLLLEGMTADGKHVPALWKWLTSFTLQTDCFRSDFSERRRVNVVASLLQTTLVALQRTHIQKFCKRDPVKLKQFKLATLLNSHTRFLQLISTKQTLSGTALSFPIQFIPLPPPPFVTLFFRNLSITLALPISEPPAALWASEPKRVAVRGARRRIHSTCRARLQPATLSAWII